MSNRLRNIVMVLLGILACVGIAICQTTMPTDTTAQNSAPTGTALHALPTGTAIQPELQELINKAHENAAEQGAPVAEAKDTKEALRPSGEDASCEQAPKKEQPKKRICGAATVAKRVPAAPQDAEQAELAAFEKSAHTITKAVLKGGAHSYKEAISSGAKLSFVYSPDVVYDVYCKPGFTTNVDLQPGEEILFLGGGDTARWTVAKSPSGSGTSKIWHVMIKPHKQDMTTNVVINTDKHQYNIRAYSRTWYTPLVGFVYPDEEQLAFFRAQEQQKIKEEAIVEKSIRPDKLNFNYEISGGAWFGGDKDWTPVRVYDDGTKTYIEMPREMASREAPVLFVKEEDSSSDDMALVNYRVKSNVYIVDRIFKNAVMKNGTKKTITITRNDF